MDRQTERGRAADRMKEEGGPVTDKYFPINKVKTFDLTQGK